MKTIIYIVFVLLLVGCSVPEKKERYYGDEFIRNIDGDIEYIIDRGNPTYIRNIHGDILYVKD